MRHNGNKFSVYESEEKTVLGLLGELGSQINNNTDTLDSKTDLYGDHKGTWQGLDRPTMSDEGVRATVEDIIDNKIPSIETSLNNIENETIEKLSIKNDLGTFLKIKKDNFIDTINYTVNDYYDLYQSLVNSSRFDWINLGKDQSETYDIRLYRYTPTDYKSTLFVTCAIHGWEHYGSYIMYELFKMLLSDIDLPLQFKDLRNTRILCIPIANPWGLMADNHTGYNAIRRGNSRGVDLNRNFNYKWEQNTGNFGLSKGDTPFSEKETQYIKKVMEEYRVDFYLDLHSFNNSTTETRDYLFYGNEEMKKEVWQYENWLKEVYPNSKIEHTITENDSSANNYANRVRKINSMNIELIKNRYGEDDNRRWLELLINFLSFQAMTKGSINKSSVGCKFIERDAQNSQNITVPTTWTNLNNLSMEIEAHNDGIVLVNGFLCVEFNGDNTTVFNFSPNIGQSEFYTHKSLTSRSKAYIKQSTGVNYIPFSSSMFVRKGFGKVNFSLEVLKEGSGTISIKRSNAQYIFIPCNSTLYQMSQHNKV